MISSFTISIAHARMLFILPTHSKANLPFTLAFAFAIARKLYFNIFLKLLPYVVTALEIYP